MMSNVLRSIWIATLVAFFAMTCGCSRHVVRSVNDEVNRHGTGILGEKGQKIDGYILTDGDEKMYSGRVRIADQDSLVFWTDGDKVVDGSISTVAVTGPKFNREDVDSLIMSEVKVVDSALLILGVGVVVGGLVIVAGSYGESMNVGN